MLLSKNNIAWTKPFAKGWFIFPFQVNIFIVVSPHFKFLNLKLSTKT